LRINWWKQDFSVPVLLRCPRYSNGKVGRASGGSKWTEFKGYHKNDFRYLSVARRTQVDTWQFPGNGNGHIMIVTWKPKWKSKGDPAEKSETPTTPRSCSRYHHFSRYTEMFSILGHTISAAIIDKIIEKKGFDSFFLHVQCIRKGKVRVYKCCSSCTPRSDSMIWILHGDARLFPVYHDDTINKTDTCAKFIVMEKKRSVAQLHNHRNQTGCKRKAEFQWENIILATVC